MGKYKYFEWLIPIKHYLDSEVTSKNEKWFDLGMPAIIAFVVSTIYFFIGLQTDAISKLNEILPNILAILIGFSISAISVVASSDKANYKKDIPEKYIGKEPLKVARYLLIIMIITLMIEIFLLVFILFVSFVKPIWSNGIMDWICLFVYTFLTLSIFAILLRSVIYLYIANYK